MKCHNCGHHQADANTSCSSCGVAFAYGTPQITFYEQEPSAPRRRIGIGVGLCLLVAVIGLPLLFHSAGKPSQKVEKRDERAERGPSHNPFVKLQQQKSAMADACMQNMFEMGADELSARSNCLDDREAQRQIQEEQNQEAEIRNIVDADEIGRAELLLSEETSAASDPTQSFLLRLRLYDRDGKPASSEGELSVTFSPEEAAWGGMRQTRLGAHGARIVHITSDDSYFPMYELSGYQILKDRLGGADRVDVTVTFNDRISASARFEVTRTSK